jgi:DedD protein
MSEPHAATPESVQVKRRGRHRLIGAITLAVLAVVIIPMVLDSEPRKVSKDLALTIPPKEGLPPLPPPTAEPAKPAPVAEPAKTAEVPAKPAETEAAEKSATDAPKEAAKESKPAKVVEKPVPKTEAKPADKAAAKSLAKTEGFAIQLGAFKDQEKLAALKAKMKTAKVPVFTEDVKIDDGPATRLRAGPYKTREQAEKALAQVKKAGGGDGKVVPLP